MPPPTPRPLAASLLLLTALASQPGRADWQALRELCVEPDSAQAEERIQRIVASGATCADLSLAIQKLPFPQVPGTGVFQMDSLLCTDGAMRPFVTWIPSSYDPTRPSPLFIWLHGGVSRQDIYPDPLGYAQDHPLVEQAEKEGWLLLFPFGQAGAVWWDSVGIANVDAQIRLHKQRYNVDDNRVWLGGFSDGASAAWFYAMALPRQVAALVALNGHMGVASLDGDLPTYAPNMAAATVWATHTELDGLYPARKMAPTVEMARLAGASIHYHVVAEHGHDFDYAPTELPALADWLKGQSRERFPARLYWESAMAELGECRWLRIDRVRPTRAAPWHRDWNHILVDDRITIGFVIDQEHQGDGVRVSSLVEDDSPARRLGLQSGDIIVGADELPIRTSEDLGAWKATTQRGARVELQILRGQESLALQAELPEAELYYLFKRTRPSAAVRVRRVGNVVHIDASRLGAFTLRLHPELFDLSAAIRVEVEGKVVWEGLPQPDPAYLLRNFWRERDRSLLWVGEIAVEMPPIP